MDETNVNRLRKTQAPVALLSLQTALMQYVEDVNTRLQAGLAVLQTQAGLEVLAPEKKVALLRLSLTLENHIHYTQFIKRRNEVQSGVIYVRSSQDGMPAILFSDFPHPSVEVSYQEASKRLLNASF
jgi:hypothetical protein